MALAHNRPPAPSPPLAAPVLPPALHPIHGPGAGAPPPASAPPRGQQRRSTPVLLLRSRPPRARLPCTLTTSPPPRCRKSLNPPVLIFGQSKERANELYKELAFDDVRADVIHADLTEYQRQDAVDSLRAGKTWVLIATEVIARGMDFKGQSGRAGRSGEAITFFTEEDKPFLRNIANVLISSDYEVPSWIMALPKLKRKKHRVQRDPISTLPYED